MGSKKFKKVIFLRQFIYFFELYFIPYKINFDVKMKF